MDQPTTIEIRIKGDELDVKRAVLKAMARIDRDTRGFDASNYVFGDGSDFEEQMKKTLCVLGNYRIHPIENSQIEFKSVQESYGCDSDSDIKGIADAMIGVSPNVEFHIAATITADAFDGYDTYVDINYLNGELKCDVKEYHFDDEFDDEDEDEDEEYCV